MNILITNDDGISSPVLPLLARWASKLGNVTIAAPTVEQSGKSHAIHFTREIEITTVEIVPGLTGYAVDSTPADCVRFATHALSKSFDLIIAGINRGYNLGDDIVYSGTCGAVFESARMGIRGLALSADIVNLMDAPDSLDEVWSFINENALYDYNLIYNVNIPPCPTGIRITKQGGMYYCDTFLHKAGHMYIQAGEIKEDSGSDPTTDINTVRAGVISVLPLNASRTEMTVFDKFNKL